MVLVEAAWSWLFSDIWKDSDNTPHGAAKRILWLIQFGVPMDWAKQRDGNAPLCYSAWEIVNESTALDGSGLRLMLPGPVERTNEVTASRHHPRVVADNRVLCPVR